MNQIQLFLNDKPVDLSDDSPIALTFQINDLAEVQNQQGNTSNQFKISLTQNNRAILGYADDITIQNPGLAVQVPYSQLSARVVQNGIEVFPNAIAEINEVDDDTASITILSGNVDFFDSLGGQLADMGDSTSQWSGYGANLVWKPFDHKWNLDNVAGSQGHTEKDGWIYPVVDYGMLSLTDYSQIDVRNQRPGFFIKKAIDLLVQSTGYTAKGSLLNDPLYPLLIAQFSNGSWEHGSDYQNQPNIKGILVSKTVSQYQNHPDGDTGSAQNPQQGHITFDDVIFDPSSFFNRSDYTYVPDEVISVDATLIIPELTFFGHPDDKHGYGSNLDISIMVLDSNADVQIGNYNANFSTGYDTKQGSGGSIRFTKTFNNIKISGSADLSPSTLEKLQVKFFFNGYTGAWFTISAGTTFQVTPQNKDVKFTQDVQCERILPDMSQKDFLKDTLQRFGIICQTDIYTKTINFASLTDIVNNIPLAKDWTTKCIDQGKQLNFRMGNYAQVNYMEYQTDPNILPLKLGWDQIIINDKTLNTVAYDMIVSKFGPSLNRPYYGGTIAQIAAIDPTTAPASGPADFTVGVQPRILVDQKIDLRNSGKPGTPATITFTDGQNVKTINDIISVPYFYKPDGGYNLCWCDMPSIDPKNPLPGLRRKYYGPLQKILQNTKILIQYFLLTPRDIAELDLLVPIYLQQHNAYFYINKIDSWRKGQPCKVELVRLG